MHAEDYLSYLASQSSKISFCRIATRNIEVNECAIIHLLPNHKRCQPYYFPGSFEGENEFLYQPWSSVINLYEQRLIVLNIVLLEFHPLMVVERDFKINI